MVSLNNNDKFAEKEYSPTFVKICFTDLTLQECCGRGSFGTVYRANWISQEKCVAVKVMSHLGEEVSILSTLSHRNIIKFYGACCESPNYCIVSEYAPHGSLHCFLASPAGCELKFCQMLCWAKDVALGMNYLHEEAPIQVIHRDLKSKNILIGKESCLKICDFGASRTYDETTVMTIAGTYPWMAPELIQGLPTSQLCDVYSFGVVLWELLTQEMPFKDLQGFQVAWNVVENHERPVIPSSCPQPLSNLIQRCWQGDPSFRPAFNEILSLLNDMSVDEVLEKETNEFALTKPTWVEEVRDGIDTIRNAETKIRNAEDAVNDRNALMKLWSKRMKDELKRHSLFGYSYHSTFSRSVSCNYHDESELSVDSKNDATVTKLDESLSFKDGDMVSFGRVESSSSLASVQQSSSFLANVCQIPRERCGAEVVTTEDNTVSLLGDLRSKARSKKLSPVGGRHVQELLNSEEVIKCGSATNTSKVGLPFQLDAVTSVDNQVTMPSVKVANIISPAVMEEALKRSSLFMSNHKLSQLAALVFKNLELLTECQNSNTVTTCHVTEIQPSRHVSSSKEAPGFPTAGNSKPGPVNFADVTTQTCIVKTKEEATQTHETAFLHGVCAKNKSKLRMMRVRSEDDAIGFFSDQTHNFKGKISSMHMGSGCDGSFGDRSTFQTAHTMESMTNSVNQRNSLPSKSASFLKKQTLSDSAFHSQNFMLEVE